MKNKIVAGLYHKLIVSLFNHGRLHSIMIKINSTWARKGHKMSEPYLLDDSLNCNIELIKSRRTEHFSALYSEMCLLVMENLITL